MYRDGRRRPPSSLFTFRTLVSSINEPSPLWARPTHRGWNYERGWESDLHAGFVLAMFGTLVMGACGSAQLRKWIASMRQARNVIYAMMFSLWSMVWITSGLSLAN